MCTFSINTYWTTSVQLILCTQATRKKFKTKVCPIPSPLAASLSRMHCCPSRPRKPDHYHLLPPIIGNIQSPPVLPDASPIFVFPFSAKTDLSSAPQKVSVLIHLSVAQGRNGSNTYQYKRISRAQEAGSALASLTARPKFYVQYPYKSQIQWYALVTPALGRQWEKAPWGVQDSQFS